MLDRTALEAAVVQTDPCLFLVVPRFVRPDALNAVNRDFPAIDGPGSFDPRSLRSGPAFDDLIRELQSPLIRAIASTKFGVDLEGNPLQMDVRRFSESSDGNLHTDSKSKVVTALVYFNERWQQAGGRLRICKSSWDLGDYVIEVPPEEGALVMFKRSDRSFHGFKPFTGERRSLQMYWVKAKRAENEAKELTPTRLIKRLFKHRPR
jgi:SM-20-related protein